MDAERRDRAIQVMQEIQSDVETDTRLREGMAFTGRNVAEALGVLAAQVQSVARGVEMLLREHEGAAVTVWTDNAAAFATHAEEAIDAERHDGVRSAVHLLVAGEDAYGVPALARAHKALYASFLRQARMAGCHADRRTDDLAPGDQPSADGELYIGKKPCGHVQPDAEWPRLCTRPPSHRGNHAWHDVRRVVVEVWHA